ncbi:MAG: aldehyde dehydrogenase family protein [Spirochaetota bacterium]
MKEIQNWIDGGFVSGEAATMPVDSPIDGSLLGSMRFASLQQLDAAVQSAAQAQKDWAAQTLKARSQVMYDYRGLLRRHRDELAELCHLENGKSIVEAHAGVDRAVELAEFAASTPNWITGRIQAVSRGVECRDELVPVGVCGSIAPFNFPIMVPHWTMPLVLVLGNAMILKPSEFTPLSALKAAQLLREAGLPDALLQVILGAKEIVEGVCDHPGIEAVSFVGSTPVAELVYRRCAANLKRVATFGGAKNHIVLLPDADPEMVVRDILASATGMSGQRCMAASVLLAVGDTERHIEMLVEAARDLKPGLDLPPLISQVAVDKIGAYLDRAAQMGARVAVDGRKAAKPQQGYYVGASIIDYRNGAAQMPEEEIFGPTLEILGVKNIREAAEVQRRSPYGNAASVFTQNGRSAAELLPQLEAGMLGVNIGVPVPRDPFAFGGVKASRFGTADITGPESLPLWTCHRKITTKWNAENKVDWMS